MWICSWQRSGSTWLAEMIASAPGTRLVYEPANLSDRAFAGQTAATIELPHGPGPAVDDIVAALRGEISNDWVDQINRCHVVHRRVVKDVRGLGVAGDVADQLPDTPIVVLVRHPLAVARSVAELGWTAETDSGRAILAEVSRWCEMHAHALADRRLEAARFVSYESLVSDPLAQLTRTLEWASTFDPTWRAIDARHVDPGRPSSTDFLAGADRTGAGSWSGVDREIVDSVVATIEEHGLGELYGRGEGALCDLSAVAARLRSSHPGRSGS
jgi:sulfotransferase family protein